MEASVQNQSVTTTPSEGSKQPSHDKSKKRVKSIKSTSRQASDKLKAKAIHKSARSEDRFASSRQRALEKQFSKAEKKLKASVTPSLGALSPQASPDRATQMALSPTDIPSQALPLRQPEATFTPTAAGLRDPIPQQEFITGLQQMLEKTLSQGFAGIQQTLQSVIVPHQQTQPDDCLSVSNSLVVHRGQDPNPYTTSVHSDASSVEEEPRDSMLSDDEDTAPDPPAFVGLFPPEIFKSLLTKAKTTSELGAAPAVQQNDSNSNKTSQTLFSSPIPPSNLIPTPNWF